MATRARKKTPSLIREPAVTVTRASMRKDELVYVLVADKKSAMLLAVPALRI